MILNAVFGLAQNRKWMGPWIARQLGQNRLGRTLASLTLVGFSCFFSGNVFSTYGQAAPSQINDENPLAMPEVGDYGFRVLSPTLLELTLITTQESWTAPVSAWDFVGQNFSFSPPSVSEFSVTAPGRSIPVRALGFKRRTLYAPLSKRDLRIGSYIYLELSTPLADNEVVQVTNPNGRLWSSPVSFNGSVEPLRFNPAIHVSHAGYMPGHPKKAMVGYYLGSMGEMSIPAEKGFKLIDAKTGGTVFQGSLTLRKDWGFTYTNTPYQKVYQADFTAFDVVGEYKLLIPDLGTSFPFRIDPGVTASFARTFALGLYHQRCGGPNHLPYTRHTHENCHMAPAEVPSNPTNFPMVDTLLGELSKDYKNEPRHTAPQLKNIASSLYPFINTGTVPTARGHHDAGDYSKYTINSAGLIHSLVFAADSFPGAGDLDNLGLPESGDGKSDLLQEAKWEADFLANMQDADGGFYFLVYPKNRRYENNVTPDHGDPQVVWPKTTAVTAAAVAALAEIGSSPRFKQQFPAEAAVYLQKAHLGWTFLMNAIAKHGTNGAYQKITHYGHEFMHDDELAWAASAMYAATGQEQYQARLFEFLPNPNDPNTRRWTWWKLFEGYGCAIRTYAFAGRSFRLPISKLNTSYLARCEAEIVGAGDDHARWSQQSAYGTSLPDPTKMHRSPGWFFSSERAFDVTVAYQITPKPEYIETILANCNYEGGLNPLNMPHVTGMGWRRQQEVVSQYAWNDRRILPPSGLPQGNVRQGHGYVFPYTHEEIFNINGVLVTNRVNDLPLLAYPSDLASVNPYAYYDRWTDMLDTVQEFVVMDMGRSLASLSFWMARGPAKTQAWKPVLGVIQPLSNTIRAGAPASFLLTAPGVDLSTAQVAWEVRFMQPDMGNPLEMTPKFPGDHWIEAEALLPDGRRVFAVTNFTAMTGAMPPNSYQAEPLAVTSDIAALYHADEDTSGATGLRPNLTLSGNAQIDNSNLGWMNKPAGGALRFFDLGDQAQVQIPSSALRSGSDTTSIALEAMIYINSLKAYDRGVATIFSLNQSWDAVLEMREDKYAGLIASGGFQQFTFQGAVLHEALKPQAWHHFSLSLNQSGYTLKINGKIIATQSSGDLTRWGNTPTVTLTLGNFDGWIDEVAVRSFRSGAPALPNVSLITPISGSTIEGIGTITVSASASASGASVQKVEFYAGKTKIGEDTTFPYEVTWSAPAGNYNITAKAYDSRGLVGISAPAGVTILAGSSAASATLLPISMQQGRFMLMLEGETGRTYRIQASENHKTWADIGTVRLVQPVTGFLDPTPAGALRFYRAILVQ